MRIRDVLIENYDVRSERPLKSSDRIKVYHGFNDIEDLKKTLLYGLSGKERPNRRYSYESNNNPYGLFVSPDLNTAKQFGSYIIEFGARVSDLESPVWPSGTFASQGQYAEYFDSDQERENEKSTQTKNTVSNSRIPEYIRKSDDPLLAKMLLMSSEPQALFTGNLNPNSIKAVWIQNDMAVDQKFSSFDRYPTKEAKEKLFSIGVETPYGKSDTEKPKSKKLFKPRDEIKLSDVIAKIIEKYPHLKDDQLEIIDILKNNDRILKDFLWPEQFKAIKSELE